MWDNTIDVHLVIKQCLSINFLFQGHESLLGGLSSLYKNFTLDVTTWWTYSTGSFCSNFGKPWALYFLGSSSVFLKIYLALYPLQTFVRVYRLTSPPPPFSDRITYDALSAKGGGDRGAWRWFSEFWEISIKLIALLIFYTQLSLVPPKVYCVFKWVYLLNMLEFPLGKLCRI